MPLRLWPLLACLILLAVLGLRPAEDGWPTQATVLAAANDKKPATCGKGGEEITIAAVGDIMLGSTYPETAPLPPEDGANLLAEVTPILAAADVTFGNLEGPMLEGGATSKCSDEAARAGRCYAFRVPTRYGAHLKKAGFDVMSLANNHAMDFGLDGRASSAKVLDELGIAHSGAPGDVARLTVRSRKVALIAFATYPHSYNLLDLDAARSAVAELAATSDLVVVSFHGGAEGARYQRVPEGAEMFYGENRGDLRAFTRAMIDAGADLVIGHGPHVMRGLEVYKSRLIVYSLGNFATYGSFNLSGPNGMAAILEVKLACDGAFLGGRLHPVKQVKPGGPLLDPEAAVLPLVRQLSEEDFGKSAVRISDKGELSAP
ncbi:MAG: CapA family protein [Acidobacteria bacterium]|nr:CapA family protein [Acidobacteriota bacterium]